MDDLFFGFDDEPVSLIETPSDIDSALPAIYDSLSGFRQAVVSNLIAAGDRDAAWRYANCRQEGTGFVGYCPSCEQSSPDFHALYHPAGCMLRICPECAESIANPIRDRYRPIIEHLFKHCKRGWSIKGIVLTTDLKLGEAAPDAARRVMDDAMRWCELMILDDPGAGVIVSLEAGENGQHWHAHITAYCPFIRQATISETWEAIRPGNYVTWVRKYETVEAALTEGLKYTTKFVNLSPQQLVSLHVSLKGTRRIRSRGCFYMSAKNPLRALLEGQGDTVCQCPHCNSNLRWCSPREFDQIKNLRPWLVALSTTEAVKWLQKATPVLHLTDQLSPRGRGSP